MSSLSLFRHDLTLECSKATLSAARALSPFAQIFCLRFTEALTMLNYECVNEAWEREDNG